jgi:hypothetical protein
MEFNGVAREFRTLSAEMLIHSSRFLRQAIAFRAEPLFVPVSLRLCAGEFISDAYT